MAGPGSAPRGSAAIKAAGRGATNGNWRSCPMSAVAAFPLPCHAGLPAAEPGVVACIDCADRNAWVYPHAAALAGALDFPVTLLQVLDAEASPDVRPDPIEWNLRRREALRALDRFANAARTPTPDRKSVV